MPRGIRWTIGGIAVVVLGLVIAWALFVPVADWLAHHDVGSVKGSLHETAVDNARGRLLTLGAGLFAAGALVFTARNFTLSRRTLDVTEQGQVTDRYTKAIQQLGSDKLDVRIGGIYALERVARDSARDRITVMEVLGAFIREHSHEQWPADELAAGAPSERSTRPDVQAAVIVVGRQDAKRGVRLISLNYANLTGADLHSLDLTGAGLYGAILAGAILIGAHLNDATLTGADLTGAYLSGADLTGASLLGADLTGAGGDANLTDARLMTANLTDVNLTRANLTDAHLNSANLNRANLDGANLTGAELTGAILTDARLTDADLTDAQLYDANLTGAILTGARWPRNTSVPAGWKLHTGSGRLQRAGAGSRPTEAD